MKPEQRAELSRIDKAFAAIRTMSEPIPSRERYKFGIEDVGVGGFLRIGGELRQVVGLSHYQENKSRWYELQCFALESGTTGYVEWEKDDEVEITLNGEELDLDDVGVSADQVEDMSDEEEGKISYEGRTYYYDDDYSANYHRNGGTDSEKVHFYDFETKDEKYCLAVEEWGSESAGYEYSVYIAEYIEPEAVEVLVTGGAGGES